MNIEKSETIMPEHSQYSALNNLFEHAMSDPFTSFPISVMVLEKEIRLFLDGQLKNFNTNVGKSSQKQNFRQRLRALRYRLSHISAPSQSGGLYTALHSFPMVERVVSDFATEKGFHLFGASWKNSKKNYLPVSTLALAGREFSKINQILLEQGSLEVFSDQKLMMRLETQLIKNKRALASALRRKNIRGIVVQDDSKPAHRLLSLAARDAGVPMVVMAHGYIQSPCLHSIAPVYADHLVVWSQAQKEKLRDEAPELRQSDILKCFGFPYEQSVRDPSPDKILMLLRPVSLLKEHELQVLVERLLRIAHQAQEKGLSLCIKPHPKEASDPITTKWLVRAGLEIASGRLQELLPQTALTLGMDSSGLLESQFMGIPTFHLWQYKSFEFEDVPVADADDINIDVLIRTHSKSAMLPFGVDAFKDFLAQAIEQKDCSHQYQTENNSFKRKNH